ncbi:MAG: hypothetical protein KF846_03990 [Cyclobacteriaceae bacterium]|nr:hypothetical protein [Cyclobacteriaceae bacterium]
MLGGIQLRRLCLLVFIFLSCEQQEIADACADTTVLNDPVCESFINVTPPCIIQEVLTTINGNQLAKFVYHHDGLNYNKIEVYNRSKQTDDYPVMPDEVVTMIYENNEIKEVIILPLASPGIQRKYFFDYKEFAVTISFELIEDGETTFSNSYDQLFVTNPRDSIYLSEGFFDILREYKNGNNTRFAREDKDGMCVINNQRWLFTHKMSHDSNPNVFKDYAVRFPLGGSEGWAIQFWFGINRNNMVAAKDLLNSNSKELYCYTFLCSGDWIWIKNYEFATDLTYEYLYKYSCE